MKTWIKEILCRLPSVTRLDQRLTGGRPDHEAYPPGHFYSPIPSREEILKREAELFDNPKTELEGIDLNEEQQLDLLRGLCMYYEDFPYISKTKTGLRYHLDNNYYYDSDAVFLYSMMRKFKPNRIIEIGSGFSSALMLDTRDNFLEKKTAIYFIDPHPARLFSVLKESDKDSIEVITTDVQDVNLDLFKQLTENDFLFVDSSHVAKIGSDVNFILFEVLPKLKKGVLVHFHDIYYPFIYPKEWVLGGRAWNEVFMLRAFLQHNTTFKIILFNTFLPSPFHL